MALNHFPHIYRPIQVGSMVMKNRIQFSPIVSNHAGVEDGRVGHELLEFVSTQAQTGCGLVTIGSTPVNFEEGRDFYSCLSATNDQDVPGLGLLADEAKVSTIVERFTSLKSSTRSLFSSASFTSG